MRNTGNNNNKKIKKIIDSKNEYSIHKINAVEKKKKKKKTYSRDKISVLIWLS
jgi:hypothetical protein